MAAAIAVLQKRQVLSSAMKAGAEGQGQGEGADGKQRRGAEPRKVSMGSEGFNLEEGTGKRSCS